MAIRAWKPDAARPPERLGDYEVGTEIAKGGMSVVYRGRRRSDGELVAIKIITPEAGRMAELLEKIFQKGSEGEVAASLRHPHIVTTLEYGKLANRYFIVMELIDGPNLKQLLDSGDPRWRERRFRILLEAGRGLAHIHQNGLVHRDFCPKNILLGLDGAPKIIDFGLAIPAAHRGKWRFDRSGTASYMGPEQVRGRQVDVRTDIYAFGVSACEILTGRRPFRESRTRLGKMEPHLNLDPLPPREFDASLPVPIDFIVLKAMAKSPEHRYQTMDALLKDLQTVESAFYADRSSG